MRKLDEQMEEFLDLKLRLLRELSTDIADQIQHDRDYLERQMSALNIRQDQIEREWKRYRLKKSLKPHYEISIQKKTKRKAR